MDLIPTMVDIEDPWPVDGDVVTVSRDWEVGGRAPSGGVRIWRVGAQRAVRHDLREHRRAALEAVLVVEELLVALVGCNPDVVIAVGLGFDVKDDAGRVLAGLEDLQPVRAPNTSFRRAGAAAV